ncbi:MAG: pentapeptide repeat-containing protein [Cyanobacteria bacterium SZAS-4]|nr:pentapeptide repeat-containing protein [Cyanobacteria bacterium SZAS-4]
MSDEDVKVVGPRLAELEKVAKAAESFETSICIEFDPNKPVPINASRTTQLVIVYSETPRAKKPTSLLELNTHSGCWYKGHLRDGMLDLAEICGAGQPFNTRGTIVFESILVKSKGSSRSSKDLKILALQAWCEAFGVEAPDFKRMREEVDRRKAAQNELSKKLLDLLREPDGVQKWNKTNHNQKSSCEFKNSDLRNLDLRSISLENVDFRGSNFDGANLTKANFQHADIRNCSFREAILFEASTAMPQFTGCDFSGADMRRCGFYNGHWVGCKLDGTNLSDATVVGGGWAKASLKKTNFTNAEFYNCDLKGADLSEAKLTGAKFSYSLYNAETKWPTGMAKPEGLDFKGGGADPFLVESLNKDKLTGAIDFDTLIEQLNKKFDKDRLKKSLKMLKSETFQLFSEVEDNSVVGIVKSQTDPDLVYSCRLTSGGEFSCCTQNLNACGGLRGALCKHLLVLLIGLSKANELEPTKTYEWVIQSLARKPEQNREIATEVFMRHKGAEAGELDWRPTETIPEDYYAY